MAVDPKIKQKAEDIRKKIFGSEVRESLASGLEGMSEDVESIKGRQDTVEDTFQTVIEETTGKDVISAPEILDARQGHSNLGQNLLSMKQELAQTGSKVDDKFVSIEDYGASPSNSGLENTLAIQRAIDGNYGKTIYIPKNKTYQLDYSIAIRFSINMQIDGTLTLTDKRTSVLTSDVASGSNTLQVSDGTIFHVGERIGVIDTNRPFQNTSPRHVSETGVITSIDGNVLTIDRTFIHNYTPNAGGFVTTANSVINVFGQGRIVKIWGKGVIDGNKQNQTDFEPLGDAGEDTNALCGISVDRASYFELRDLEIRNTVLHNINLYSVSNVLIDNVYSHKAHDKNLLMRTVVRGFITNSRFNDSGYEDGIICYSNCTNIVFSNLTLNNNKRYGLAINDSQNQFGHEISNIEARNNGGENLFYSGNYGIIRDLILEGGGVDKNYSNVLNGSHNIVSGLLIIDPHGAVSPLTYANTDGLIDNVKIETTGKTQIGLVMNGARQIVSNIRVTGADKAVRVNAVAKDSILNNVIAVDCNEPVQLLGAGTTVNQSNVVAFTV